MESRHQRNIDLAKIAKIVARRPIEVDPASNPRYSYQVAFRMEQGGPSRKFPEVPEGYIYDPNRGRWVLEDGWTVPQKGTIDPVTNKVSWMPIKI